MNRSFKDLLGKKKSNLVDVAERVGVDGPNSLKKKELIEELADPVLSNLEFKILYLDYNREETWSTLLKKMAKKLSIKGHSNMNSAERAVAIVETLEEQGYTVDHNELPKDRRRLTEEMKEELFTGPTSLRELRREKSEEMLNFIQQAAKRAFKKRKAVQMCYSMKTNNFFCIGNRAKKEHEIMIGNIFCY